MRKFKIYTSRGTFSVNRVTGALNAIGVVLRRFNNDVDIYRFKEVDDYDEEDDAIDIDDAPFNF